MMRLDGTGFVGNTDEIFWDIFCFEFDSGIVICL